MRKTTVSKSIRLDADTVELIEQQDGKNFTDKLQDEENNSKQVNQT
nr:MAG TPA_asm: hypothetical protein [Inoviridae sp.]